MMDHPQKKKFLNLPRYAGGGEAFKRFISENLQYPGPAVEAGVEGFVIVEYDILDSGKVQNQHVVKSLGHGCDEEALRLIGLLQFERVKNRGVRVKMTTKTRINFKLPGVTFRYVSTSEVQKPAAQDKTKPEPSPQTYGYTITF